MSTVQLNVLNGMTESKFIHSCATCYISVNLDDWQCIYQLLCISQMTVYRFLNTQLAEVFTLPRTGSFANLHRQKCTL